MTTVTNSHEFQDGVDPLTLLNLETLAGNIDFRFEKLQQLKSKADTKARLILLKMLKKWIDVKSFVSNLPNNLRETFEKIISTEPVMSMLDEFHDFQSNNPRLISLITQIWQDFKNWMMSVFEKLKWIWNIALETIKAIFKAINWVWELIPWKSVIIIWSILLLFFWSPIAVLEFLKLWPIIAMTPAFDAISTMFNSMQFEEFFDHIPELTKMFAGQSIWSIPWI